MEHPELSHETEASVTVLNELVIFNNFDPNDEECWIKVIFNTTLDESQQERLAEILECWRVFFKIAHPAIRVNTLQLLKLAVTLIISGKNELLCIKICERLKRTAAFYCRYEPIPVSRFQSLFQRFSVNLVGELQETKHVSASYQSRPNIDFDQPMFVPDQPRHVRVLVGLASVLYFAIPLTILFWSLFVSDNKILGIPNTEFLSAIIFGSLGSIISIMLRYDKIDISNSDDTSLFFMGFFKPITGAVFALVALGIYKSGLILINLSNVTDNEKYFLITIFFLSGFSERFVSDMLAKVESSTARDDPKRSFQSNT